MGSNLSVGKYFFLTKSPPTCTFHRLVVACVQSHMLYYDIYCLLSECGGCTLNMNNDLRK